MKSAWLTIYAAVSTMKNRPGDARRFTNLLIAALLVADPDDDELAIGTRVSSLMLAPRFELPLTERDWTDLVDVAVNALAKEPSEGFESDGWVREFQRADPERKSIGAYATPRGFAEAIAAVAIPVAPPRKALRVVDPSCGAGALLIACLDRIQPTHGEARRQAALKLFGMELDPAARELACLLIWMASGGSEEDFKEISANILWGNALAHDWNDELFDVLIMNPPWESLRHKASDPEQAKERARTLERINDARAVSAELPPLYSSQGSGDRNLCKAFIELAPHLLTKTGRIGALIPAAFASDEGMKALRQLYLDHFAIDNWTSFENRAKAFDIDSRYKFGIIGGTRSAGGTRTLRLRAFSVLPEETQAEHVVVDRAQLAALGGPVGVIPDITSHTELDILTIMLRSGTPFFAENELGSVRYRREMDLSLGRQKGLFQRIGKGEILWTDDGTLKVGADGSFVPVLEGRMVAQFDFFQKSWIKGQGRTALWRDNGRAPLNTCRPQFITRPMDQLYHRLAICDVTSATNTRTVHATIVPDGWVCGNTAPVLIFESEAAMFAGLAILNSLTFDWLARRMVSGLHLNKFYLSCLAWPALGHSEVTYLSVAGRQLAAAAPRKPMKLELVTDIPFCDVDTRAKAESVIARGYGLSQLDLEFMLANNCEDRRGFWRYFNTHERGLDVAQKASALLGVLR